MTSQTPDAAAAVVYLERAAGQLNLSRQYLAAANAVDEIVDPDVWAGDCRRRVFTLLCDIANTYEAYADQLREAAHDARSLRRHRYDQPQLTQDCATRGSVA